MEIKFLNQPRDIKFLDILSNKLRDKKYNKVWIVAGFAKDNAMDCILEDIKAARENGTTIECIFGLDKKNTSKDMLLKFLNMGCNIRFHLNEEGVKLESRLYVFESANSDSYVYITGGKFSEGGITSNLSLIEEIKYSPDEKMELSKVKAAIESGLSNDEFETLTEDKLKDLAATGDIVARITERKIPKISELYNQSGETSAEGANASIEYDESVSTDYSELLNKDVDIDIELDDDNIKIQTSLGEEVEHKLKNNSKEKEDETVISKLILGNEKDSDYSMMNTLIIPISKPTTNGTEIKITSSITANMLKFLEYPNDYHTAEDEKGSIKEYKDIILDIYENTQKKQVLDENACIIQTVKHTTIKSEKFNEIDIQEDAIMRLMKEASNKFRCEIINHDSPEYSIWEGFCTLQVKGSSKKFGII